MKAWNLHDVSDLRYEEVPTPTPAEGEVLIKVRAVGICGSDIPRIYENGTYSFPTIPGHEFSGEVVACGADVAAEWMGKRVGVFPLIPCGECGPCQKNRFEMCRHYSYIGSRQDGAFAEYVVAPAVNLVELPETVSYEAAAMLEPMAVAVHAMRRVQPTAEDVVVVCGVGTIGLMLLMFLQEVGVKKLLVVGNKEFQREQVLKLGISEENYCDTRSCDADAWIQEKTEKCGADVFFECVGRNETIARAVRNAAPAGRVLMVGNPFTDMTFDRDTYWKILRNQLWVTGTWNSTFTGEENDDWHYVLKCLEEGRIAPREFISHKLPLEELEKGFHIMRDKSEDYVKVMSVL